jgi:hypothetical protein
MQVGLKMLPCPVAVYISQTTYYQQKQKQERGRKNACFAVRSQHE